MKNYEENDYYKKKKVEKESANNVTEYIVEDEIFIAKTSNQDHDSKTFIVDYNATSHMVISEEKMKNLKDSEALVTV